METETTERKPEHNCGKHIKKINSANGSAKPNGNVWLLNIWRYVQPLREHTDCTVATTSFYWFINEPITRRSVKVVIAVSFSISSFNKRFVCLIFITVFMYVKL